MLAIPWAILANKAGSVKLLACFQAPLLERSVYHAGYSSKGKRQGERGANSRVAYCPPAPGFSALGQIFFVRAKLGAATSWDEGCEKKLGQGLAGKSVLLYTNGY